MRIRCYMRYSPDRLDRETVKRYIQHLEIDGASAQVRNQALAAIKRLASESAELGWIDQAAAMQIERIKSKRVHGIRTGRWLTSAQCGALLQSIPRDTAQGHRDGAVIALLLGCGLRRSEATALRMDHVQRHNGRIMLTNITGKGDRVRSVLVPIWAGAMIEYWITELNGEKEMETAQCRL